MASEIRGKINSLQADIGGILAEAEATSQCLLKQGVAGSSLKAETIQQVGVEVHKGDEVSVTKTGVILESEEDKESGEWEFDRSTISGPGVWDGIAKADKFVEQKVITASLGRHHVMTSTT